MEQSISHNKLTRMEDGDDEKHANEVRLLIEENQHQVIFLQRSQESLEEAILEFPDDSDFLEAIEENCKVIASKHKKIRGLQNTLHRVDAAYRAEVRREEISRNNAASTALLNALHNDDDNDMQPIDGINDPTFSSRNFAIGHDSSEISDTASCNVVTSSTPTSNLSSGLYL